MPMWVWIAAGLGAWVVLSVVIGLLLGAISGAMSEFWLHWERPHPTETAITRSDSRSDERSRAATVSPDDEESEFWLNWHPTDTVDRERGVPEGPTARARKERLRTD
jgi:hypothetical protein